ncbi:MAG TPA: DUF6468 domain-containing protein [Phenylobacterium sp.]|uniref:DUF6468 domain-containing protein n=1 Tax=Phenylobacterium sp. TaxID=1871053 RepID=UPI002B97F8DA|nr:DUF6468 domain-containing protein [Phenylobacterium sp.]HSV03432.1 DUF6468 domain-containing protein [Phenylobacterium sp.]
MSLVALTMNLLLASLLAAALALGWRLNRRLKGLRDSHDSFAVAVRELNAAAQRAEQGLADLRAATDEAVDTLADRIEKGRALAAKLERLIAHAPAQGREAVQPQVDPAQERKLGALLAAAREGRGTPARPVASPEPLVLRPPPRSLEDDLFEEPPLRLQQGGGR